MQAANESDACVYASLDTAPIGTLSGFDLSQSWLDSDLLPVRVSPDKSRLQVEKSIVDHANWDPVLELPRGTTIVDDWTAGGPFL